MGDSGGGDFCIIAGGGTGGHVIPGIAVGRALVAHGIDSSAIHFVASMQPGDVELIGGAGFENITSLPGRGIQRRVTLANVRAVFGLVRAQFRAVRLVRGCRPRVVLAVGGYASVACALAAVLWRVPLVVAEQNARAGLANRLTGRFARACAVSFPGTDLPRAVVTGNPVRPELLAAARSPDRDGARRELGLPLDRRVVGVFSGSLGSRRINEATRGAVDVWAQRDDLAVRHVVGHRDWTSYRESVPTFPAGGLVYQALEYEEQMDLLLTSADLVVCRAGGTVAELAILGVPSVLVPLPIAPRDHQSANGRHLVEGRAAVMVRDEEFDTARMVAEVDAILADEHRLDAMAEAATALARPDAADAVAALLEEHARD
jgi:undecaprenyldiphospho-muramoylpentapeptide beta-N-acetylglucosaminyltransferase